LLQPERDSAQVIAELKREVGSRVFAAQYRQNATPPEGNMIKAAWLRRWCHGSSAKAAKADGHGMRVIGQSPGSFGKDAHHDQEAG